MDLTKLGQDTPVKQAYQQAAQSVQNTNNQDQASTFGLDLTSLSKYDRFATSANQLLDPTELQDLRGEQQSTGAKILVGLGKFGTLTATTTADGVIGTLVGLGNVLGGDESESAMQRFINNPFTKAMDSVNKWSEETMPNYYTSEEEQMNLWQKMGTTNFWSDGVIKNMGFAAGALLSGVVTAGAADAALGGKAVATRLAKGILANADEAGKIAAKFGLKTEEELINALYSRAISATDLADDLAKDAKILKNKSLGLQMFGSMMGAQGESRFESLNAYQSIKDNLLAQELQERGLQDPSQLDKATTNRIEQAAKSGSNADFWMNMGVLSLGNMIQFGKTLTGGFKPQKLVNNNIELAKDEAGRITEAIVRPSNPLYKTANIIGRTAKVLKNPLSEGTEEQLQYVASQASEDYYSRKFDPDGNKEVHSFLESLGKGFADAYSTSEGWENFVIGALTTSLGIPSFKANGKWATGGVFDEYGELAKRDEYTQQVISQLNSKIQSPEFQNYYGALVRNASLEKDKNNALKADDVNSFKNFDDEQFINLTDMMIKAGKYEDWKDHLEALKNADPAEVRKMYETTKDEKGEELETPIPGYADMTDEELKKYLTERSDKLVKQAETYKKIKSDVDFKFGNIPDTLKETIAYNLATVGQVEDRENSIVEELQGLGLMDGRSYKEILREQTGMRLTTSTLNNLRKSKDEVQKLHDVLNQTIAKASDVQSDINFEQSKDKKSKLVAQKKGLGAQVKEIDHRIKAYEKSVDEKLQEAYNNSKVVAENIDAPYSTFEEFKQSAGLLTDKISNFEKEVAKFNMNTPQYKEDINEKLADLQLLNKRRTNAIDTYLQGIKATRNVNAAQQFQDTIDKVHDRILDRASKEKAKRYDFAASIAKDIPNVINTQTGEQFILKKVGDSHFIIDKNEQATSVELNREFVNTFELESNLNKSIPEVVPPTPEPIPEPTPEDNTEPEPEPEVIPYERPFDPEPKPKAYKGVLHFTTSKYVIDANIIREIESDTSNTIDAKIAKANVRSQRFWSANDIKGKKFKVYSNTQLGIPYEGIYTVVVNEQGNPIGLNGEIINILEDGIFQAMPLPNFSLSYVGVSDDGRLVVSEEPTKSLAIIKDGRVITAAESLAKKDELVAIIEDYNKDYAQLKATADKNPILDITTKLQGLPVELAGEPSYVNTGKALAGKDVTFEVATGTRTSVSGMPVTLNPGRIYALDNTSGNVIELQPNNVNAGETESIINLISQQVSKAIIDEGKISLPEQVEVIKKGVNIQTGEEETISDNINLFDFIRGIVYIQDRNNLTKAAKQYYKDGVLKLQTMAKDIQAANPTVSEAQIETILRPHIAQFENELLEQGKINPNPRTQFYYDNSAQDGYLRNSIVIAGTSYKLANVVNGVATINEEVVNALREFLPTRNSHFSAKTVKEQSDVTVPVGIEDDKVVVKSISVLDRIKDNTTVVPVVDNGNILRAGQKLGFRNNNDPVEVKPKMEPKVEGIPSKFSISNILNMEAPEVSGDPATIFNKPVVDNTIPTDLRSRLQSKYNKADETPFRLATTTPTKTENIAAMRSWLAQKFGNKVRLENVQELIEGKAWGKYKDAVLYVYNNAEVGTTYHEAFHSVLDLFLTARQKQALLAEAEKDKRLASRINKAAKEYTNKPKSTIIEEALAEEFRDFMLDEHNSIYKKSPVRKNLFQRILDFIREVVLGKTITIEELFNNIDKGVYKNRPKRSNASSESKYRIEGKSVAYANDITEGVNYYFFQKLFSDKMSGENTLFQIFSRKSSDNLSDEIKEAYEYAQAQLLFIADDLMENAVNESVEAQAYMRGIANDLNWAIDHWDKVVAEHTKYLKKFNLELNYSEDTYQTEIPEDLRNGGRSDFNKNSLTLSSKANASRLVKLYIATIANQDKDNKLVRNSLWLPTTIEYGKSFNMLMNKLSSHTSIEKMVSILDELSTIPQTKWTKSLANRLRVKGEDIYKNWSFYDVDMITKLTQSFGKNTNQFRILVVNEAGDEVMLDSNATSTEAKIKARWGTDLLRRAMNGDKYITKIANSHIYNKIALAKLPWNVTSVNHPIEIVDFLAAIGVKMNADTITVDNYKDIEKKVTHMRENILKGNFPLIYSRVAENTLTSDLSDLIKYEVKNPKSVDTAENSHYNLNGDLVYDNTLHGFLTYMVNNLQDFRTDYLKSGVVPSDDNYSEFLQELYTKYPFYNDPYITNSILLRSFYKTGKLSVAIVEGSREGEYGDAEAFSKFKTGDRLRVWFNMHKRGLYVMSRPADNGQERFLDHGSLVKPGYMTDYLLDEINNRRNIKADTIKWKHTDKNIYNGIVIDLIKSGLDRNEGNLKLFTGYVKDVIDGKINIDEFMANTKTLRANAIANWVNNEEEAVTNLLKEYKLIDDLGGKWRNNSLMIRDYNGELVSELSQDELRNEIRSWIDNNFISQVEQTKLFLGDTMFSKSIVDKFKRNNANVSTKKIMVNESQDSNYERWIQNNLKRVDGANLYSENGKRLLRTIVLDDVQVTNTQEDLEKVLSGKALAAYKDMTEGDGMSYISPDERREIYFRTGDWTMEAEDLYQWSMQSYLGYKIANNTFTQDQFKSIYGREWNGTVINPLTNEVINRTDILVKINSDKVQYCGPLAEKGYKPTMYKTSTIEINPLMFMNEEFTEVKFPNLEKLLNTMIDRQVGVISHFSANKGYTSKVDPNNKFYKEDGTMNNLNQSATQDTYYDFWGIQLDTGFDSHHETVTGTQMMKQFWNGIYNSGAAPEKMVQLTEEMVELNAKRIKLGQDKLINRLGLTLTEDGYSYSDKTQELIDQLKDEAISRNMADNVVEGLEYLAKGLGVEPLLNREKVENILFSIADRETITQKMFGKPSYQIPSTLYERSGIRQLKDGKLVSNDLKFYTNAEGKTTRMEVYLPSWMKGIANVDQVNDKNLLNIIGYRIPTQGPNSIEAMVVKGFLSSELGDVIVLPTEIVAKAGSDFDIDKLFIYLPNPSKDEKAKIENRMMEIMGEVLLDPSNFKNLITPIASETLNGVKKEINTLRKVNNEIKYHSQFASIVTQNNITKQNMEGSGAIGIAALASTFHIIGAKYGFKVASELPDGTSTQLNLAHNEQDSLINIGSKTSVDNKMIWEMFNEYVTATVDNAKDPILDDLNAGLQTLNTVLYLVMAGVPVNTVHYFMNQPIIRKYVKMQEIYESQNANVNGFNLFKKKMVEETKKGYGEVSTKKSNFTNEELTKMIGRDYNLNATEKSMQLQILDDFIRYQETAKWVAQAIQGITYDTRSYGKNLNETLFRLKQTEIVLNSEVIVNYDKALGVKRQDEKWVSDGSTTFLSPYRKALEDIRNIYEPMFVSLYNKDVENELDKLLTNYSTLTKIGSERILKVMDSWKQDFITYLLTTKSYSLNGEVYEPLSKSKLDLFKGEDSLPNRIKAIQDGLDRNDPKYTKYQDNSLIRGLQPVFNQGSDIHNLKFISKGFEKLEMDEFTDDWRQLFEGDPESIALGLDLVRFVINQSGIGNSPINFINFVPSTVYGNIATSIMNNLTEKLSPEELANYTTQWRLHNPENSDIVPYGAKKVTDTLVHPFYKDRGFKESYEYLSKLDYAIRKAKINELKSKGINPYSAQYNIYDSTTKQLVKQGVNFKDFRNDASLFDYSDNYIGKTDNKFIQEPTNLDWTINSNESQIPFCK